MIFCCAAVLFTLLWFVLFFVSPPPKTSTTNYYYIFINLYFHNNFTLCNILLIYTTLSVTIQFYSPIYRTTFHNKLGPPLKYPCTFLFKYLILTVFIYTFPRTFPLPRIPKLTATAPGSSSSPATPSSSGKVKTRSRSKSPFRSFRWRSAKKLIAGSHHSDDEGILGWFVDGI